MCIAVMKADSTETITLACLNPLEVIHPLVVRIQSLLSSDVKFESGIRTPSSRQFFTEINRIL